MDIVSMTYIMGAQSLEDVKPVFMFDYTKDANSEEGEYLSNSLEKSVILCCDRSTPLSSSDESRRFEIANKKMKKLGIK